MELKEIYALMDRFAASGLTGLEVDEGNLHIKLEKAPAPVLAQAAAPAPQAVQAPAAAPDQQAVPAAAEGTYIRAPLVGTFYAAPAPDKPPFVSVGDTVKAGQTVCVLEAMKMMSEVPAPCDCVIEEVVAANGALAEFDAPLFRIREIGSC